MTIFELFPTAEDLKLEDWKYQPDLTEKLDVTEGDFNQEIINEIVLWKVNRYASLSPYCLQLLNKIDKESLIIDRSLTKIVLFELLQQKGVRLAMASTILRFRNPNVYQIIDQRAFRFLTGKNLDYPERDLNQQLNYYLEYLDKLSEACKEFKMDFKLSDRILYRLYKIYNVADKIKY